MKTIMLIAALLLGGVARAAEPGYALLSLRSAGMDIRGASGTAIAGGNFDVEDDGRLVRYSRKGCAEAINEHLLSVRAYSASFAYIANGAYSVNGAVGRMLCIDYDTAAGYYRRADYWNAGLSGFFKAFGKRVAGKFVESDFAGYSIFPLEKDDAGASAGLNKSMALSAGAPQKTSFDCNDPDLSFVDDIICHDRKLAAMDVALAALYREVSEKHPAVADTQRRWETELQSTMYPAGIEELYEARAAYLRCVKEKGLSGGR
jgi:hypothetical protein